MSDDTGIEWTHLPGYSRGASWNPVRGCEWASPGCDHCYARSFAERWRGVPGNAYEHGFDLRLAPNMLDQPLRWQAPRGIFTNSMSDLFQRGVPDDYVLRVLGVMAAARRHVFMTLTKRAGRMRRFFERRFGLEGVEDQVFRAASEGDASPGIRWDANAPRDGWPRGTRNVDVCHLYGRPMLPRDLERRLPWIWPLPNAWWGVSVDDRRNGIPRIRQLRQIPAAVRFLSIEPLLEDIADDLDLTGIDWVIVGGESGPGARPFDFAWARRILTECREQGVPFFMKQVGAAPQATTDVDVALPLVRHRKGGAPVEWPPDLRVREWPLCIQQRVQVPTCA